MAGNVRGAMRPQGRSPPFLLIGLCVALCILGFNYWSLSYRNRELGGQIIELQDQVRRSMSKRMTAERRGATVVDELKKCESTLDTEKNEIARKESEVISLSEQLRNKVTEMTDCESKIKDVEEIRTNLKTCEENNIGINQELQKKKEELKAAIQQAPAQDAERCKLCKGEWTDEKKSFLNSIEKVLGPTALTQLQDAGIDIGSYAQEIDTQHKPKVDQLIPQVNGPAVQNVPIFANGQPAQEQPQQPQQPQPAQEQPQQAQPQPAQAQAQPAQAQAQAQPQPVLIPNQLAQQPPAQAQAQPVQGPQAPVVMAQGSPDNNVIQAQPNPQNSLLGNPAGNLAETNALGVNGDNVPKPNGAQPQNAVGNNLPPVGNLDVQHPGGDFVPVANPGVENAAQTANDGQQANLPPADKVVEPVPAHAPEQPIILEDPAQNRVERPSDMSKTTAGNSFMSLNKSNTPPLPKDVLLSAPNNSLSSRTPTQSVQTDAQMALHASQSNNTANNQTSELRSGLGLPTAYVAVESNAQMKFKQNAGQIPIDENSRKIMKDGAAKVRPPLFDNNYNSDFNEGNALQQVADTFHHPNLPQKSLIERLSHHSDPNADPAGDADTEEGRVLRFPWLQRDRDGHKVFIPNLEGKASDDYNDFQAPDSQILHGGVVQDEDSIDKMQHNMNMEDDRMNHLKNVR